jgi:hypothetical protein
MCCVTEAASVEALRNKKKENENALTKSNEGHTSADDRILIRNPMK